MEPETLQMFSSFDEATGHWYTGPSTAVALWFQAEFPAEELDSLTSKTWRTAECNIRR